MTLVAVTGFLVNKSKSAMSRWSVYGLAPLLRQIGVFENKHIPSSYLRSAAEQRLRLLQGLMDTDGTAAGDTWKSRCEFTTTSPRLYRDVYELLVSLGIVVRVKEGRAMLYGKDCGPKWRLFFTPPMQVFQLPRKAERLRFDVPRKGLRRQRFIKSVEPAPAVKMRCIAVDSPSQLYLAGRGMIPTHNSTISSIKALHCAEYQPGALILLLAPSYRQSKELFRKVKDAYASLVNPSPLKSESALEMEFENTSRIVALPGKEETIRGFSGVSLLIVDEASRVPDALYQSVRPMLAVSGGSILLLSTPFGKRGFFHAEWEEGGSSWHRTKITAYDCPRISREWLEQERKTIGDWWFRQEYLCEFVETTDQVFSYDDIQRALDPEVKPLFGRCA
jgi:hypothetical protein